MAAVLRCSERLDIAAGSDLATCRIALDDASEKAANAFSLLSRPLIVL